jgi:hypothetical protein
MLLMWGPSFLEKLRIPEKFSGPEGAPDSIEVFG